MLTSEQIQERNDMRASLIAAITPSVGGSTQQAEYVVNLLTVHHPELLAAAARVFAADWIGGDTGG